MTPQSNNLRPRELSRFALFTISFIFFSSAIHAQDGNTGLAQANTTIRGYYTNAVDLMYAIGGISGIIGAIKVYQSWGHEGQQAQSGAAKWFAGCIFLVTVSTVIKSFFGL